MEPLDFNKDLMDYLYGEMDSSKRKEFEARLKEDQKLKEEYDALVAQFGRTFAN